MRIDGALRTVSAGGHPPRADQPDPPPDSWTPLVTGTRPVITNLRELPAPSRIGLPDAEAPWALHTQMRTRAQQPLQRRSVAVHQGLLEPRIARQARGGAVRRDELVLVGRQRRTQPGLQACVDPPRLAPGRNRRESPESGRQRQQRQQQEIGDELDFETSHDDPSSPSPGCRWIP